MSHTTAKWKSIGGGWYRPDRYRIKLQGGLAIDVLKHYTMPDSWLLASTCMRFTVDLETNDLEEAKKRAFAYVHDHLRMCLFDLYFHEIGITLDTKG